MLSVLIVDDEFIEREGLSFLLKQSPYEFQIFMAEDGETALHCLKEQPIDIIFTDIKMPFMDGLELIVEANQLSDRLKIVIFTAFADFEYAKKALENKVMHYFLKPVDPDEFRPFLDGLVKEIEQERVNELRQKYYSNLIVKNDRYLFGEELFDGPILTAKREWENCWVQLYDLKNESEKTVVDFYNGVEPYFGDGVKCAVLSDKAFLLLSRHNLAETPAQLTDYLSRCGASKTCVVVSEEAVRWESLGDLLLRMEEMLRLYFFLEGNQILSLQSPKASRAQSEKIIDGIVREVYNGIDNHNLSYSLDNLAFLKKELGETAENSQIFIKYLYADILKRLITSQSGEGEELTAINAFKQKLEGLFRQNSLSGIHRIVADSFEQSLNCASSEKTDNPEHKKVIRSVIGIINSRFQENISLQSISDEVYLTPSYLSFLFKKETGTSLIKYITMVRMEKAKELLKSGNMKIFDIASAVGYQSYSYFNIAFKSYAGQTPSQYRASSG